MKNKKRKFNSVIRKLALFFIIPLLLYNCDNDDVISDEEVIASNALPTSSSTYKYVAYGEVPELTQLLNAITDHAEIQDKIDMAKLVTTPIMEVNSSNNTKTYSILLPLKNEAKTTFYNIVIQKDIYGNLSSPKIQQYTSQANITTITSENFYQNPWQVATFNAEKFLKGLSVQSRTETPGAAQEPCEVNNVDPANSNSSVDINYVSGDLSSGILNSSPTSTSSGGIKVGQSAFVTVCVPEVKEIRYQCNGPNNHTDHSSEECGDASSGHSGTGVRYEVAQSCIYVALRATEGVVLAGPDVDRFLDVDLELVEALCAKGEGAYRNFILEARNRLLTKEGERTIFEKAFLRKLESELVLPDPCEGLGYRQVIVQKDASECPDSTGDTPIFTPDDTPSTRNYATSLTISLNLNEAQKAWVNNPDNKDTVDAIGKFYEDEKYSNEAGVLAKKATDIFRGAATTTILSNIFERSEYAKVLGYNLFLMDPLYYFGIQEHINNITKIINLSPAEWVKINNTLLEIRRLAARKKLSSIGLVNLTEKELRELKTNENAIALLPSLQDLKQYWPKNQEEWKVIGQLASSLVGELLLATIPGADIIEATKSIQNGDTIGLAFALGGLLVDALGGTAVKGFIKAGKVGVKVFKAFAKLRNFATSLGRLLAKKFGVKIAGDVVQLTDDAGKIIVKGEDAIESFTKASTKLDNLGDDAFKQLKNDPDFIKAFDDVIDNKKLNDHTFKGDVTITGKNAAGDNIYKVTGIHSNKAFLDGTVRIKPGTQIQDLGDGFYKAKVEKQIKGFINDQGTNWKVKNNKSTFFPDSWSTEKIQAEIAHAFKNKTLELGNKFSGFTTTGHKITMFLDELGNIKTAFPNL
ncbi:EndoU domain-containing protein [Tenacibaculum agarivorans]|uniref:EndoU domain-containing protein n=1 Tax=Tenacibaculum agarivorans TaxID=1908389 RepID=UPI00094BB9A0|nr:EndoU domain-containing protein [Tenacibaculum agarivorans]